MPPHLLARAIRYVNFVIALALVAALFLLWWYGWRPLPRTSGTLEAGVAREVQVVRGPLGEPHIRAASLEDALYAQGYVTAQDRLWQMDGLRRVSGGELAEVLGPAGLESDREARRLRLRRIAEGAYLTLEPAERAALAAYARGVNDFIKAARGRLSAEFALLGYQPRPWSVVDSLLVGLQMYRTLTTTWTTDVARYNMLSGGDAAKVNFLFPARGGGETQPGSNAWVLSGAHTASGKPLLANDMHLEWSLPGAWHMAHLAAPGLDAAGVALPGLPGIIVGHNRRIAWGVTNLGFDVQDLYLETFDERSGRYLFRGQVEQARAEREVVRVRGAETQDLLNWVTRHGPLFAAEGAVRMSLRWTAAEPSGFHFPFVELDRAENWQQFTAALARYPGPAQNFVYADVYGNIGYHAAGLLPVRRNFNGDVPVDGASGNFEWDGFVPFAELPAAYNPPRGVIVTANQNPFPEKYAYHVNGNFAAPYRSGQIRALLGSRERWRAADMLAVQKDVYSAFDRYLARAIVAAWDRASPRNASLEEAIGLLRTWNGQMEIGAAAPLVVTLAYDRLVRAAANKASPGRGGSYQFEMAPAAIERLLRERPPGWFSDYDALLLHALEDGLDDGRRVQGRYVARWHYGGWTRLRIRHPVLGRLPLIGDYFNIGPAAMSGSPNTVKQTSSKLGPSMRMDVDLGDWDRSFLNLPAGESGQPLSGHYKDQWARYYAGESYSMQFDKIDAKRVLRMVPRAPGKN